MSDIVILLKELASYPNFSRVAGISLMLRAADEIEKLRQEKHIIQDAWNSEALDEYYKPEGSE